jgi:hypothetical protein
MEIKPTVEENSTKSPVETLETSQEVAKVSVEPILAMPSTTKPVVISAPSTSSETSTEAVPDQPEIISSVNLWEQVNQLWEQYFGEGKKSNLVLVITILITIPLLIAASALLGFLNKLPVLPSIFELVGFGYSVWFVYRYLLFAHTRQEITDAIASWKQKIFG